tara:strand:- start:12757 stop:13239 length:483 start_codon:yes stop_codon:yes gene_type:complete
VTPQDPLAALQPLRSPDPVAFWPPAPGWWILAALGCAALALLSWSLLRRYQRNRYRRLARAQLRAIEAAYHTDASVTDTLSAVNMLLKGVCLQVYPRREVAALSGTRWLQFLNGEFAVADSKQRFPEAIARAHAPDPGPIDIPDLLACADTWLRRHRGHA